MGRHVLITGSTSRVGIYFLNKLIKNTKHDTFWLLIRKTESQPDIKKHFYSCLSKSNEKLDRELYEKRVRFIKGDLLKNQLGIMDSDYEKMRELKIGEVYHFAAANTRMNSNKEEIFATNIDGTLKLLRLCSALDVHLINYFSTLYSVRNQSETVLEESVSPENLTFNNISEFTKKTAEVLINDYCKDNNLKYRIFRSGFIIDSRNYSIIEKNWYYYFLASVYFIKIANEKVFGKTFFERNDFHFLLKDTEVYLTTPFFLAECLYAIYSRREITENKVYHIYNNVKKFSEISAIIGKILDLKHLKYDIIKENIPLIERHFYDKTYAFIENVMDMRRFCRKNLNVIIKEANIPQDHISDVEFESIIRNCLKSISEIKKDFSPGFFKRIYIRLNHGRSSIK